MLFSKSQTNLLIPVDGVGDCYMDVYCIIMGLLFCGKPQFLLCMRFVRVCGFFMARGSAAHQYDTIWAESVMDKFEQIVMWRKQ